jgi:hypothetical protein
MNHRHTLFFIFCLMNSIQGLAQTSLGAISGALAGAGRSSVDSSESYLLNPATVAHLRGAAISFGSATFRRPPSDNSDQQGFDGWHLSLNENSPDAVVGTSIYLSQTKNNQPFTSLNTATQFNDAWLTLGNFIFPQLTGGLSYHYHESQTKLKAYEEHNLGMGFLWTPWERFGVGVSVQNLKTASPEIPDELTLGTTSGVGLLYLHEDYLRLRLDFARKMHKLPAQTTSEWAFGLENAMTPWLFARIGLGQQKTDEEKTTQKVTFGLGFAGPRFGIHYGFQQFQLDQQGTEHSVDFMIPF